MEQAALERRVDTLEASMKEPSCRSMRTEIELARPAREMRELNPEVVEHPDHAAPGAT